jgi:hypothetical protein
MLAIKICYTNIFTGVTNLSKKALALMFVDNSFFVEQTKKYLFLG